MNLVYAFIVREYHISDSKFNKQAKGVAVIEMSDSSVFKFLLGILDLLLPITEQYKYDCGIY